MASIEKIRKKRGAGKVSAGPGARDAKDDKDTTSRQSSVISVKEATTTDQHDTVEKGTAEEGKTEKSPSPPPRLPTANSRPSSATSHRSTQSAQRAPPDPAGSMVSLKSRQAWTDAGSPPPADSRPMSAISQTSAMNAPSAYSDPSTNPTTSRRPRTNNAVAPMPVNRPESARSRSLSAQSRPASARSLINSKMDANTSSCDEVKSLGPAEMNEAHAYVPYIYARDSIGKIMVDMKNMKYNHIRIVHDIEDNFRLIEDETQAQFNLFVLNLRDQYGVKVKTFRQVIEVHRLELQQKDQYWEELLLSLSGRNTSLLKDKKVLLIQNKVEFERLEREHNETVVALTTKLDETNLAHAKSKKEMEAAHEVETKTLTENKEDEIKTLTENYEGEKKVLSDELETEKQEVERLRKELENVKIEQSTMVAAAAVATHVQAEPSVVVADLSEEDRARMEEERATMSTERDDIMADRQAMEKDREEFINQRRKHQEDHVLLQGDLNTANKEREEWRVKYESLRGQLGELAEIKAKYEALYAQFTAISAIAVAAAVDDKAKADDKIAKTEADRDIMLEEKVQMDRDIEKWEAEFKEKNNRQPEDKDRPDSIQELIVSRQEAQTMVTSLDTQIETLETLKKGEVPVAEAAPVVPITIQEPEIRTVEVKVPDPEVVAALQTAETEIDKLKSQLAADKDEMSSLRGSISDLQSQLEQAKAEISKLEAKVSTLETQAAAAVTAGVAVAATGDLEARVKKAEKAKKAVEKDLKAALKANNKTAAAAAQSDKLLEVAVREVRAVHGEAEGAAALIEGRLAAARVTEAAEPGEDNALTIQALEMLATGNVPEKTTTKQAAVVATAAVDSAEVEKLQDQVEELEGNNKELEEKNEDLEKQVKELKESLASGASLDAAAVAIASSSGDDLEELSGQISELQKQVDDAEARLAQEKSAHGMTRDELDAVQAQLTALRDQVEETEALNAASMSALTDKTQAEISNLKLKLTAAEARTEELDKARLANVPMDTQKEIKALKAKVTAAEKEKDAKMSANADLQAEVKQFKVKMAVLEKSSNEKKTASSDADQKLKQLKAEKDKEIKESVAKYEKREKDRAKQEEKKIAALEKKIQHLEIAGAGAVGAAGAGKGKPDKAGPDKATQEKLRQTQRELNEAQNRIKQLDKELASAQKSSGGSNIEAERERKKQEKVLKELEKKLDQFAKKNEKNEQNLKTRDEELDVANKSITEKDRELAKLKAELDGLGVAAAEGLANAEKVKELTVSVKKLTEENKVLTDNYNSERVLRKKYYNMVEDMKGKIRVYCRVRPMSKSELDRGCSAICKSPDEYTIHVEATRGLKEFQFDNIFMPDVSQERVFEDTNNLVQSAVDGYNVCIFAYGQTGSGKTYTIIGDTAGKSLGIAPRAFQRIFDLGDELKEKFDFKVQVYMLELYNDKLLDLFTKTGANEDKMDIKKDKKGMVVVQGAEIKTARNVKELGSLFEEGSKSRHVASTKMNAESSRSHLVVGIVIETTNKISGQVVKGKLSLVDLAGSERAAKTEASAEQLKEAMSINKSLSALGDVISALSSEQSFIPYRNNKLTMLMQDSLGGNAKTLMFVNVSPADYNADETVTSLTYAARVKLITNDASKNADNKEIARLKGIISKLKSGEAVEEEEEGEAEG